MVVYGLLESYAWKFPEAFPTNVVDDLSALFRVGTSEDKVVEIGRAAAFLIDGLIGLGFKVSPKTVLHTNSGEFSKTLNRVAASRGIRLTNVDSRCLLGGRRSGKNVEPEENKSQKCVGPGKQNPRSRSST